MEIKKTKNIDLQLLSKTIDLMNQAKDFQVIAEIIFDFIKNFINYNMAVIYKINNNENILEIVSCIGSDAKKIKNRMPFKIGDGTVGLVAKDKKAILIDDVLETKEFTVRQYCDEDPIIRTFLAVPLVVGNKVIGILSVSNSKPNQYDEYDVQMINIIASQGAVLLELNNNLTETKKFSDQILENVNSGVMVINNKYEIIIFNKSAEKITGYQYDEIKEKNIKDIPLKLNEDDWLIEKSMKTGKIFFEEPGYMIRKDGYSLRIRLSTSLMYDDEHVLKSCICIFRDNTEVEKLQRQIVLSDKLSALGRLTAGIAHEIRNPLLPIRNASEYLLNKYVDDNNNKDVVKLLSIIKEESERLNRFLGQLVNMSKDSLFSIGDSVLQEALEETNVLLSYNIKKNNIKLNIQIDDEIIILPYNKDNLKQVLLNLILNAIDAINQNTNGNKNAIDILVTSKFEYCIIEVLDSGVGISKEELDKIFDPFYTTKESGTGIGLSIVFNIVNNLGGKVLIDSEKNKGTKVTLLLPLIKKRKE